MPDIPHMLVIEDVMKVLEAMIRYYPAMPGLGVRVHLRLTHHTLYPGKGPESLELPKYMCLAYPLARNGPCCSLHSRPQLALWGRFSYSDARRHPRGSLVPYEGKENQFHPAPALQGRVEPDGLGSCCRGLSAHSCSSPRSKDSPPFF